MEINKKKGIIMESYIRDMTLKEVGSIAFKYKKAYNILMEYWDYIPDDEKVEINNKLKEIGL